MNVQISEYLLSSSELGNQMREGCTINTRKLDINILLLYFLPDLRINSMHMERSNSNDAGCPYNLHDPKFNRNTSQLTEPNA